MKFVEEATIISETDPDVTVNSADGTANKEHEVARYVCADDSEFVAQAGKDFAYAYLSTTVPAETEAAARVRLVRTNSRGTRTYEVARGIYTQFKEAQDATKKLYFRGSFRLQPKEQLRLLVTSIGITDSSLCKFVITGTVISRDPQA